MIEDFGGDNRELAASLLPGRAVGARLNAVLVQNLINVRRLLVERDAARREARQLKASLGEAVANLRQLTEARRLELLDKPEGEHGLPSQIQINVDNATVGQLRTELRRLDDRLCWMHRHHDDGLTAGMVGWFRLGDRIAAARADGYAEGEQAARGLFHPVTWQPGDPVYPREPDRGRCADCGCEVSPWPGPATCPECGRPMEPVTVAKDPAAGGLALAIEAGCWAAARQYCLMRFSYHAAWYAKPEYRDQHIENDVASTADGDEIRAMIEAAIRAGSPHLEQGALEDAADMFDRLATAVNMRARRSPIDSPERIALIAEWKAYQHSARLLRESAALAGGVR